MQIKTKIKKNQNVVRGIKSNGLALLRGENVKGVEREREINSNKVTLCELLSFSQKFREKFNRKKSEKLDVAGFGHFYTMKSQTTCV
jgi:hypothetical protein